MKVEEVIEKLRSRAEYYQKNATSPDSQFLLLAAELRIQAEEISQIHGKAYVKQNI